MRAGLFDRTTRGLALPDVTVTVDPRAVALFAETLGMLPSPECAALPSFFTFVDAQADTVRRRRGEPTILERIRCDQRYLLHGEERYELPGLIKAGDCLTIKARIADFYDSSGGHLEFAVIEQSAIEDVRGLLVKARRTYIHRLAG